jgi:Ca2+-binding RTX toxin-like protein
MNPTTPILVAGKDFSQNATLSIALEEVQIYLRKFSSSPEFISKMRIAFGGSFATETALKLGEDWGKGDLSDLPAIEVVPSAILNGANDVLDVSSLDKTQFVFSGSGADRVNLVSDNPDSTNRIYGGAGNDILFAGGLERLFGGAGDDTLDASAGVGGNRLYGGDGNDELLAGANDVLFGALHHCEMICSFFLILKVSNLGSIAKNA